ncbi:hypothetical protein GCM10027347_44810 [Larkinella harenae]
MKQLFTFLRRFDELICLIGIYLVMGALETLFFYLFCLDSGYSPGPVMLLAGAVLAPIISVVVPLAWIQLLALLADGLIYLFEWMFSIPNGTTQPSKR